MFEWIKAATKRAKRLLLIAVVCILSLTALALFPTAQQTRQVLCT